MERWYYCNKKATVEEKLDLSIFRLNKWNLLNGYASTTVTWTWRLSGRKNSIRVIVNTEDDPYVRLQYTLTDREGNKKDIDFEVRLTTTPCNFGGVRYWFCCPLCGQRVGCLYSHDDYFCCRTCANLTYESRNESRLGRFGNIGYCIVAERKMEELYMSIKRWTWRGKPTRRARKLKALQAKMDAYEGRPSLEELLIYGK